jgi:hypothetical protein
VTTWFSVPEAQFGGIGGSSRHFGFVGSGYSYQPAGTLEALENVRIPIWSTKTITAQWFGRSGAMVEADLHPVGTDRVAGTVTNRQVYPLTDAILAFGRQVYLLGTIAPGATIRVELSSDRTLPGHLGSKVPNYMAGQQPGTRDRKINRGDLMLALMFHGSESTRTSEPTLGNATLQDLDLTGQLALDRPMLVARIDRPGARLVLENAPSPPKIDQTTLLRVILPLKKK